ncbi:hypothetical protein ACFV1W_23215 [Kitasatospora sp. NPDC059648]|uniref:hypothetical protein n=1 Tax=Kitasatospora sp. NPDC059648 TaxID=3346894 RepID=UPI0036BCCF69
MPAPDPSQLPEVAIGRHPDHGIIAALPTQSAAAEWMLERLEFQRIPGHPSLFALADQQREADARAAWAAKLLTGTGYRVDTDMSLAPANTIQAPPVLAHTGVDEPENNRQPAPEPDIAFAEHPRLGIVAATADTVNAVERGGKILEAHGWQYNHVLDVYTLPAAVGRGDSLEHLASATTAIHRAGDLRVAVEPQLASDVAAHRATTHQAFTTRKFRVDEAVLAAAPSRPRAIAAPAVPPPAAVDPRIAFARAR